MASCTPTPVTYPSIWLPRAREARFTLGNCSSVCQLQTQESPAVRQAV